MTTPDEMSGIFAATITFTSGRTIYDEDTADAIDRWVRAARRSEPVAFVDKRELPLSECHGIWTSPGTSPE